MLSVLVDFQPCPLPEWMEQPATQSNSCCPQGAGVIGVSDWARAPRHSCRLIRGAPGPEYLRKAIHLPPTPLLLTPAPGWRPEGETQREDQGHLGQECGWKVVKPDNWSQKEPVGEEMNGERGEARPGASHSPPSGSLRQPPISGHLSRRSKPHTPFSPVPPPAALPCSFPCNQEKEPIALALSTPSSFCSHPTSEIALVQVPECSVARFWDFPFAAFSPPLPALSGSLSGSLSTGAPSSTCCYHASAPPQTSAWPGSSGAVSLAELPSIKTPAGNLTPRSPLVPPEPLPHSPPHPTLALRRWPCHQPGHRNTTHQKYHSYLPCPKCNPCAINHCRNWFRPAFLLHQGEPHTRFSHGVLFRMHVSPKNLD